jgi:hypothetical protein
MKKQKLNFDKKKLWITVYLSEEVVPYSDRMNGKERREDMDRIDDE